MNLTTIVEHRRALHEIPEPGFQEFQTQQYLLKVLSGLPQEHLTIALWKTGIVVKINGTVGQKTIGWRADMDGLPITEQTGLDFRSQHNGYMHACGHDCHMSIALQLATHLAHEPAAQNIVIYFQPAEEGPGGAEPMLHWLRTERPDLLCDEIYALHIAPERAVGEVATKPGLLFANTSELLIDLQGLGGHAAYPHTTRDMAVAAAQLLCQLQTIVSRNVDPLNSVVVTVGKMTAGTVQNVIAEHARLEGTIRTLNVESMQAVKKRIEALCEGIRIGFECNVTIDYGAMYYEVNNNSDCVQQLLSAADEFSLTTPIVCQEAMTGEDFGYFLKEIPGAMFWAGAAAKDGYGLHHAKLVPDEQLLEVNAQFVEYFLRKQ